MRNIDLADSKRLAKRLRTLRERTGLSQCNAAYLAGATANYANKIEKGDRKLSVQAVAKYCDAIGVSIAEVFEEE